MKSFIITVDTEGDNLWTWKNGQPITTKNVNYIPRFQELCEKYNFIPTYLTNYEMAMDSNWVDYSRSKAKMGLCEIGMHIHAWNSPPLVELENNYGGNAYISEYPEHIIEEKIRFLSNLLRERYQLDITSCRSGRWATNEFYFKAIDKNGFLVDCSITPELDLSRIPGCSVNCGNSYLEESRIPSIIYGNVLEVPMTTRHIRHIGSGSIKHKVKTALIGEELWLRPHRKSLDEMILLSKHVEKEGSDYLEFMIHSSELMPGGSPYFITKDDINNMYDIVDQFFSFVSKNGYCGVGLSDYAKLKKVN